MNENKSWPFVSNYQSLIRSNLNCAGKIPYSVTLWPTYSTLSFKKSYLSRRKLKCYFWNNWHTHSIYTRMDSKFQQYIKISSMIVLLPEISFLSPKKTLSVSITVTYSLKRVPIFRRVSINSISNLSLKLFIVYEYKPRALVVLNGMTSNLYFWFSGVNKYIYSLSTWQTDIWWYTCLSSRLMIRILFEPAPTGIIA